MTERHLRAMRVDYPDEALLEADMAPHPLAQFQRWLDAAVEANLPEPNAMIVATMNGSEPTARTVLLKDVDARGFSFFTNLDSRKGRDLAQVPRASAVFPWFAMSRQVVVSGPVAQVPRDEAAAYFASRPRGSQLGAWASRQSSVIEGREPLEDAYRRMEQRWPGEVPLPDHWGGFLILPTSVEFWRGRESRLHDRLRYVRSGSPLPLDQGGATLDNPAMWSGRERLSP